MTTITIQDLKRRGAKAIPEDVPVYLIVNSKPKSVLLPVADYESLMDMMEEFEDIKTIEKRKNEKSIKLEDVFPKN
jgi:PHD/YefM family antitoxin component YafN of YafNO toxin-antitoxin module